ncbi:unnamed protein product [Adineta ricciae]|uniref:Nuclear receptor domain-containing protein n=1 Tax=Adineta ricciae TaxID=249248 RepID=A0A813PE44_ADIRI|nr:unnamed protein product [Adineta ricciae]
MSSTASEQRKARSNAKRYKSVLMCAVCEGDAHGYNFDAITCESCKAFFRRNALRPIDKLKCRGNRDCDVKVNIKKRCKRCRIVKCLAVGMRKEWILTDKERQDKRVKIEANRRLRRLPDNDQQCQRLETFTSKSGDSDLSLSLSPFLDSAPFNNFDWFMIRFLQDYYSQAVKLNEITGIASYPQIQPIRSTEDLFRIPLYITAMRLISYMKQIIEFQTLCIEDQLHLIKSNLLTMCFFHSAFIYNPTTDCYHEENTKDPQFSGKDWTRTLNKQFHNEMKHLRNGLIDIFQLDDIVIKLFLVISAFSLRIPLNGCRRSSSTWYINNSLEIFNAQNVYIDLAYRYSINQYGFCKGSLMFSRYVHKIMKLQELVDDIKFHIGDYINVQQISGLLQSLLE